MLHFHVSVYRCGDGCLLPPTRFVNRLQITNQDAERVNRAWAGRPGTLIRQYNANISECMGANSGTPSGSCIRVGQASCTDSSAGTVGWIVDDQHQLQAPPLLDASTMRFDSNALAPLCLSTQSDNNQQWPFTSPIPTSRGKYDGSLHETGVGNLLVNCSLVAKQGNWVRIGLSVLWPLAQDRHLVHFSQAYT